MVDDRFLNLVGSLGVEKILLVLMHIILLECVDAIDVKIND